RPWAIPGTPGLEHRIGGLEKQDLTGNVSYDPENHDLMTRLRAEKIAGIASDIPALGVDDPDGADEKLLIPELNLGQLRKLIRAEFLVDAAGFNLVRGLPFRASEVQEAIEAML